MHASTCRREFPLLNLAKQAFWAGLVVLASAWAVPAFGQSGSLFESADGSFFYSEGFTGRRPDAWGAVGRLGVYTGPAVGRDETIVPIEIMPYAFLFDEGMLFGDIRGFKAMSNRYGGNFGGGYRQYLPMFDRIIGMNAYYDHDETSGALFRQWGVGFETYGKFWDARVNTYFPAGTTEKQLSIGVVPGSAQFITNYLYFDQERVVGSAMKGIDMEVGTPLPGEFLQGHDVRMYAGWYHFQSDSDIKLWGWKGRLQGNVTPSTQLSLEVTNDKVFDTCVVFGASWSYGGFRQDEEKERSMFDRMTTPVQRNYNVVVARTSIIDTDIIATNPETGNPYFFEHVASYATGPYLGTVENPFQTIAEAQAAAGGDIIFVHANSVYNGGTDSVVNLEQGVRVLGEGDGVNHFVNVSGIGQIELPRATDFATRPTFLNSPGNAVTLANSSEFSGFIIGSATDPTIGPTGSGIFGDSVGGVVIRQTDINYAQENGIHLLNTVGRVEMRGVHVNNPTSNGLYVQGGAGNILFVDDSRSGTPGIIDKNGGTDYGLLVENTTPGPASSVLMLEGTASTADINTTGVQGILISNAGGSVTLGNSNINDSPEDSIQVIGGGGNATFAGTTNVNNSSVVGSTDSSAILIRDKPAGSSVQFGGPVTIDSRNERGFAYFNNAASLRFLDTLTINADSAASSTGPALEYQANSGVSRFSNISINGSSAEGILIGTDEVGSDNNGSFIVSGNTNIQNSDVGVRVRYDDANVQFSGLSVSSYGTNAIWVENNRAAVSFNNNTLIDGTAGSLIRDPAILIQDNTGTVAFGNVSITNVTGAADPTDPNNIWVDPDGNDILYASGVTIVDNPSSVSFSTLSVDTVFGGALLVGNTGVITLDPTTQLVTGTGGLTIGGGSITSSTNAGTESAINIVDSVMDVTLTSVDVFSYTNAIRLVDNVGLGTPTITSGTGGSFPTAVPASFTITGSGAIAGSGGSMTQSFGSNIFVRRSGDISLNNIISSTSVGSGIDVANTRSLVVSNAQLATNGDYGIVASNVPLVSITGSTLNGNGTNGSGFEEIRLSANLSDVVLADTYNTTTSGITGYTWLINQNFITDGGTDGSDNVVSIFGNNSASSLIFQADQNTISSSTAGSRNLDILWAGQVGASVTQNVFNTTGGLATGLRVNAQSTSAAADIEILTNQFGGALGGNTAIDVTTNGPSTLLIGSIQGTTVGNVINLNGSLGTTGIINSGMVFDLGANTVASIYNNQLTLNGDGDRGMQFTSVTGPGTSLLINNNQLDMNGLNGNFIEEGIVIDSIIGNINLIGTQNNIINFNNSNFFNAYRFPPSGINGTIIINGQAVP